MAAYLLYARNKFMEHKLPSFHISTFRLKIPLAELNFAMMRFNECKIFIEIYLPFEVHYY